MPNPETGSNHPEFRIPDWVQVETRIWPLAEQNSLSPWRVNVIVAASHPGEAKALSPLIKALVGKGAACQFITSRPYTKEFQAEGATGIAEQSLFNFQPSPSVKSGFPDHLRFSSDMPNLVLFGASDGEEVNLEHKLIYEAIRAKESGLTAIIAGVEDYPANLKTVLNKLNPLGIPWEKHVSALFLASTLSKRQYTQDEEFPVLRDEIYTCVGQPAFDILHLEDTKIANQVVRQRLGITPTDIVISHFAGRGSDQYASIEIEATKAIGEAVAGLARTYSGSNFVFLHRMHPGDRDPRQLYEVLGSIALPRNLLLTPQHLSRQLDTRLISAASNLITATFSSTPEMAALRGARNNPYRFAGQMPLYFFSDQAQAAYRSLNYEKPITIQVGASAVAYEEADLLSNMRESLFNHEFRSRIFANQNRELGNIYNFHGDITAAERILHQIRRMLNKRISIASAIPN